MKIPVEIGGVKLALDPSAISAIRYRAEYGDSIINHLAGCETDKEAEGCLLRMCHAMLADPDMDILTFASLARRDKHFTAKALRAKDALLSEDPKRVWKKSEEGGEPFDEYKVLALLSASGIDTRMIYELPIMHLLSISRQCSELKDPNRQSRRKMTDKEMQTLYPR